jgi:hypothetical protein
MPRRKKQPEPASQDELNGIMDAYREQRAPLIDRYFEARRRGDIPSCQLLWDTCKGSMMEQHKELMARQQGITP